MVHVKYSFAINVLSVPPSRKVEIIVPVSRVARAVSQNDLLLATWGSEEARGSETKLGTKI